MSFLNAQFLLFFRKKENQQKYQILYILKDPCICLSDSLFNIHLYLHTIASKKAR